MGEVKISFFKGWESMVPPDLRELIDMELLNWDIFFGWENNVIIYMSLTIMESKAVTLRWLSHKLLAS